MTTTTARPPEGAEGLRKKRSTGVGSGLFAGLSTGSGALILVVLAAVAAFLLIQAWPALTAPRRPARGGRVVPADTNLLQFVGPLVFGTLLAAAMALAMATPVAIGIALFISHYAPRRFASGLGYLIDLLAAIPSVVYGLWGVQVLVGDGGIGQPAQKILNDVLGFIPLFAGTPAVRPGACSSRRWCSP